MRNQLPTMPGHTLRARISGRLSTWRRHLVGAWRTASRSPHVQVLRRGLTRGLTHRHVGILVMAGATLLITGFIALIAALGLLLPDPGLLYLPLIGMLAYHYGWRDAMAGSVLA